MKLKTHGRARVEGGAEVRISLEPPKLLTRYIVYMHGRPVISPWGNDWWPFGSRSDAVEYARAIGAKRIEEWHTPPAPEFWFMVSFWEEEVWSEIPQRHRDRTGRA